MYTYNREIYIMLYCLPHRWEQDGRKKEKITLAKEMVANKKPLEKIIKYTKLKKRRLKN